jgi:hypothetical protein
LQAGLRATLAIAMISAAMSGIIGVAAYLKQSPLPADSRDGDERDARDDSDQHDVHDDEAVRAQQHDNRDARVQKSS